MAMTTIAAVAVAMATATIAATATDTATAKSLGYPYEFSFAPPIYLFLTNLFCVDMFSMLFVPLCRQRQT